MNLLAHALIAGANPDHVIGSVMGDFVHGVLPTSLPPAVLDGVRLHRAVDSYTDSHPIIVNLRTQFQPPFRRFSGMLVDVWFDHLLSRDFTRWDARPLDAYCDQLHALFDTHAERLPADMWRFIRFMREYGLPAGYRERPAIGEVYQRMARRFSRPTPLAQAMPVMESLDQPLEDAFNAFFPELTAFAADWLARQSKSAAPAEARETSANR
ncbi:ACP phosphodiesterase [Tahibacter amnicola]|uniref:ACP phosphodiesterase n=1 Tax=Tahibacter amnicola TaxID=2976241 RepID=A0ABY6BED1_9GAMM|nr:ACP phosphodiesterase [Tahibacter amnicola]UXI68109.1 ACP phosphodiesterase [Tahibacter amnicola]